MHSGIKGPLIRFRRLMVPADFPNELESCGGNVAGGGCWNSPSERFDTAAHGKSEYHAAAKALSTGLNRTEHWAQSYLEGEGACYPLTFPLIA